MKNKISVVCQGYFTNYKVMFNNVLYFVKVENDDFNEWDISIKDIKGKTIEGDLKEDIKYYLEEEKCL